MSLVLLQEGRKKTVLLSSEKNRTQGKVAEAYYYLRDKELWLLHFTMFKYNIKGTFDIKFEW